MNQPRQDPKEWFDQFASDPQYESIEGNQQWCERHWAPCPILEANGMGAAIELTQVFVRELLPTTIDPNDAEQLNVAMKKVGRICCKLGDERMYEIWGHWPPSSRS